MTLWSLNIHYFILLCRWCIEHVLEPKQQYPACIEFHMDLVFHRVNSLESLIKQFVSQLAFQVSSRLNSELKLCVRCQVATCNEQIRRKRIQLHLVSVWRLPWYRCRKVLRSHFCFQSNCISLAEAAIDFDPNTTGTHSLKKGEGDSAPFHIETRQEACSVQSCVLDTVSLPLSAPEVLVCVYNYL